MFRKLTAVVLALTLLLTLGCVGTALAEDNPFSILSIWPEDTDNGLLFKGLSDAFTTEVDPSFKYDFELVSTDNLPQKVMTLATSNDLPTVFAYDPGVTLKSLIDSDFVVNISQALKDLGCYDQLDAGAVALLGGLTGTEDIYDLPLGMNIEGFWYNKACFEKAGIETAPTTWEEMLADADKLLAAGIQPFAIGGQDCWPATRMINAYVMRLMGVDAMNKAGAGEIAYTDPGIVKSAQMLQDMCNKNYFGVGPTTVDLSTAVHMVMAGQAAILYDGSWITSDLTSTDNPAGEDGIGFFNIPTVEGGVGTLTEYSMNCGTVICMSKAKYDDRAAQWLKYFVTHAGDYAINTMGSLKGYAISKYPDNMSGYTKLVKDELSKVTASSTWFEAAMTSEVSAIAQQNVTALMTGEMTAEAYCQSLQDTYESSK